MPKIRKTAAAALWIGLVFAACAGDKSSAEKAARGFMDAYYVQADLKKAAEFADSLALDKVTSGIGLRDGLSIDDAAHHPKIHYKLNSSNVAPDRAEFLFDVEYHPEKAQIFRKRTRLVVRSKAGGAWKVTQFSDHDPL